MAELLTSAQVAERADVTVRTVARWTASGQLVAAHKLPGTTGAYLFDEDTVERFLEAQRSPA